MRLAESAATIRVLMAKRSRITPGTSRAPLDDTHKGNAVARVRCLPLLDYVLRRKRLPAFFQPQVSPAELIISRRPSPRRCARLSGDGQTRPPKSPDLLTTLTLGTKIRAEFDITNTSDNAHPPELEYPPRSDDGVILIRRTHLFGTNHPPPRAVPQ